MAMAATRRLSPGSKVSSSSRAIAGAGIGKLLLLAAVENWGRSRGLTGLGSDAALDNLTSRLSHALWGFDETERVVRFRKTL